QYHLLLEHIMPYMQPDQFGIDGKYTVSSLYFDSESHNIYFETKNKLNFRQKLRLRIYDNTDLDNLSFFEVKQKHNKVVNKRRMSLPLHEAYTYISTVDDRNLNSFHSSNLQVFREIDRFKKLYHLRSEMVVSYDRHAI